MTENNRIAIFISFSGQGGVEHMVNNLAQGFLDAGIRVDMVIARAHGDHFDFIPEEVNQIVLGTKHTWSALPGLVSYLRKSDPAALLAIKDRAIRVAVLARWISGKKVRLVGRIGTTVSAALEDKSPIRKWAWRTGMRLFYKYYLPWRKSRWTTSGSRTPISRSSSVSDVSPIRKTFKPSSRHLPKSGNL
jgi:hypothetical protein